MATVGGGRWSSKRTVDNLPEPWVLSQVTAIELIVGARDKRDLVTIDNFLSLYPVVPLSERIGARAYKLLKSYAKSHGLYRHEERAHPHHAQPKALRNDRGPPAEGAELLAAKLLRIMLPCPRPRQTERIPDVPGTRGATMQG